MEQIEEGGDYVPALGATAFLFLHDRGDVRSETVPVDKHGCAAVAWLGCHHATYLRIERVHAPAEDDGGAARNFPAISTQVQFAGGVQVDKTVHFYIQHCPGMNAAPPKPKPKPKPKKRKKSSKGKKG